MLAMSERMTATSPVQVQLPASGLSQELRTSLASALPSGIVVGHLRAHQTVSFTIVLHPTADQGDLITRGAHLAGLSVQDFVLQAACEQAQDVVLDQVHFSLSAEKFQRFCAALDSPPEANPGLARLLAARRLDSGLLAS